MPTPEAQEIWDKLNPPPAPEGEPPRRKTHWQANAIVAANKYRQGQMYVIDEFTCATCPNVTECGDSFGLFNTDGDCSQKD